MVILKCQTCSKDYEAKSRKSKYCSYVCKINIISDLNCELCKRSINNVGIHLKNSHKDYTLEKYIETFPNAKLLSEAFVAKVPRSKKKKLLVCQECNKELQVGSYNKNEFCSKLCKLNHTFKNKIEGIEYVTCQLCGYKATQLVGHISQTHGLSGEEYREKYKSPTICEEQSSLYSDKVAGDKNPRANHGGKYSPWTKGSVNYSEEAIAKANQNRSYETRIDYWLDKGYTEEQAKEAVSERQRTFTLEKCIERHGYEKGTELFYDRQLRWQATLDAKSDEEKAEINNKKASNINFKTLWDGVYKDKKAHLYLVEKQNGLIKIGITTQSIKERFRTTEYKKLNVLLDFETTLGIAFTLEQLILREFKQYRCDDKDTT